MRIRGSDKKIITRNQLLTSINLYAKKLDGDFDHVRTMFKLRGKKPVFTANKIERPMKYINSVLMVMYGVKISMEGNGRQNRNQFLITHKHPFDGEFNPRHVPKKVVHCEEKIEELPPIEWTPLFIGMFTFII